MRACPPLAEQSNSLNFKKEFIMSDYYIHPSSFVDTDVSIGKKTKIWHFCHILKNTNIGENCILGQNVMIGPDVVIGNRCKIQNNISIYKGVILEDDVFCGPSCVFTNVINPRAFIIRKDEFKKTLVKKGATIGANATIVCGNKGFFSRRHLHIKEKPAFSRIFKYNILQLFQQLF